MNQKIKDEEVEKGIQLFGDDLLRKQIAKTDADLAKTGFFEQKPTPPQATSTLKWFLVAVGLLITGIAYYFYAVKRNTPPETEPLKARPSWQQQVAQDTQLRALPPVVAPTREVRKHAPQNPSEVQAEIALAFYTVPELSNIRGDAKEKNMQVDEFRYLEKGSEVKEKLNVYLAMEDWFLLERLAHDSFSKKEYDTASRLFIQIARSEAAPFAERAEWYAVLSMYAAHRGNSGVAQHYLQTILADEGHPYHTTAKEFHKTLSKLSSKK